MACAAAALNYRKLAAALASRDKTDIACPLCGPVRQAAANRVRKVLRLWRGPGFVSFHCARCGESGFVREAERCSVNREALRCFQTEAAAREQAEAAVRRAKALALWQRREPLAGTPAEAYLRQPRGIACVLPATLGYLPPRGDYRSALIAAFGIPDEPARGLLAIADKAVVGVHLTKLKLDSSGKAAESAGDKPKIMVGREQRLSDRARAAQRHARARYRGGDRGRALDPRGDRARRVGRRRRRATAEARRQDPGLDRLRHHRRSRGPARREGRPRARQSPSRARHRNACRGVAMKGPDLNDLHRDQGPAAVRERLDKAKPYPNGHDAFTLTDVHAVFRKWLGEDYDLDTIDAALAAAASERLSGDPLWLLVISGPGNAKTETVQSLAGAGAHVTSTIASEGALLSATPRRERNKTATGGLLAQDRRPRDARHQGRDLDPVRRSQHARLRARRDPRNL